MRTDSAGVGAAGRRQVSEECLGQRGEGVGVLGSSIRDAAGEEVQVFNGSVFVDTGVGPCLLAEAC